MINLSEGEYAQIKTAITAAGMAEGAWCAEIVLAAATAVDGAAVPSERLSELAATLLPTLVAVHRLRAAVTDADSDALAAIEAHAAAIETALTALLLGGGAS